VFLARPSAVAWVGHGLATGDALPRTARDAALHVLTSGQLGASKRALRRRLRERTAFGAAAGRAL